MGRRKSDDRISRSVSLLISMLVRYPEVGSVKYDPRQQTIRLRLLVSGPMTEDEFERMHRLLVDTLEVYNQLDNRRPAVLEVARESFGELTAVSITRDVPTMSPAEIWTIVEFFREWFPERLTSEPDDQIGEDELLAQDEMIEEILADLERGRSGRDLIAIREEGRVMVFQK